MLKRLLVTAAMCLMPLMVLAQTTEPPKAGKGELRAACSADIQKFCANTERGKGQTRGCLESHTAELADACKAAMAARTKN
jgi:hypothetical protein